MSNFTLNQLLLSCMLTGIAVSLLVTSIHSQWTLPSGSQFLPGPSSSSSSSLGGEDATALRSKIELLSSKIAASSPTTPASSSVSALREQCPPCPTCGSTSSGAAATPSSAVVASSGSGSYQQAFADYIELHKKILAKDPSVEQRFIVARPMAQMNNRLRVIVGGIVLGMLTKRAFLIEFSDGYYASLADVFDPPIDMDLKHFDAGRLGSQDSLAMEEMNTMLCTDYNTRFTSTTLGLGTPPNLIPFFWRNSFHRPTLQQWFGIEEPIYRLVAQKFLKPSTVVQQMKDKFMEKHFANQPDAYKLGIHLRWGGDMRPQPIQPGEWEDMAGCVEAVVPSQHKQAKTLHIFVAADTPESREKADLTLKAKFPSATILFYETWLRSNTPGGVQAALTELLLLSECDNLVLTPASSYGEQAQALNGKPGYFIRSTVPDPARVQYTITHEIAKNCLRPYSTQPTIEFFSRDIKNARCYHPDMHNLSF